MIISNSWHISNEEKESKLVNQNEAKVDGYGLVSMMAFLHKWKETDDTLFLIKINICEMCDQSLSWSKRVYMEACLVITSTRRYIKWSARPKWRGYKEL